MLRSKIVFCFDIQNNICTQLVLYLYSSGNSMNNLLSYFGLTDSKMRPSGTDLPVQGRYAIFMGLTRCYSCLQDYEMVLDSGKKALETQNQILQDTRLLQDNG